MSTKSIDLPVLAPTLEAPSALQRLLTPSLSDLFFLFITAWMFLVTPVGWQRLLIDADAALHTRIGKIILATGAVPQTDPFSFSKPGEAWYAFEWLSETLFALAHNAAGLKGLTFLAGMLISLYFTVLFKHAIWKGASGLMAIVVTLMAVTATSIHFHARPHLFTQLLLAAALWLLDNHRKNGGRLLWLLVPISVIWVNLHGGVFLFFALLFLRFAGCVAEAWFWPELRAPRRAEAIQLAVLGVACGLASLANPYGVHMHLHIVETLRSSWILSNVAEFKSPSFRSEEYYDFMILLFIGMMCIPRLIRDRKIVEPLGILFLGYASLTSLRHLTMYVLFTAPIISVMLSEWWAMVAAGKRKASLVGLLDDISRQLSTKSAGTSLFIPACIAVLAIVPGLAWPVEFPEGGTIAVKLIERNADLFATSRVFASDQTADYLIYRNYPKQRVFMDSRHNYYGEKIGNEFFQISNGTGKWKELLDSYRINLILAGSDTSLASLLTQSGQWKKIDHDEKSTLWERIR